MANIFLLYISFVVMAQAEYIAQIYDLETISFSNILNITSRLINNQVDVDLNLFTDLPNVLMRFVINIDLPSRNARIHNGTYKLCDLRKNFLASPILSAFLNELFKYSNMTLRCSYPVGYYVVRGFLLDPEIWPLHLVYQRKVIVHIEIALLIDNPGLGQHDVVKVSFKANVTRSTGATK